MVRKILPTLLALASLSLAACGDYGQVEQGRTVAYNPDTKIATILKDSNTEGGKAPKYDVLPPHEFKMPDDPAEIGALPTPGLRVKLDVEKNLITMYNPQTKQFENIPFQLIRKKEGASFRLQTPELFGADKKRKVFPVVNEANQSMEIFSARQNLFAEIKLSPEDFARYKPADWNTGDEVRIYYKQEGVALRFMNITKTDMTRRR